MTYYEKSEKEVLRKSIGRDNALLGIMRMIARKLDCHSITNRTKSLIQHILPGNPTVNIDKHMTVTVVYRDDAIGLFDTYKFKLCDTPDNCFNPDWLLQQADELRNRIREKSIALATYNMTHHGA